MKKVLAILAILSVALFVFSGCGDDNRPRVHYGRTHHVNNHPPTVYNYPSAHYKPPVIYRYPPRPPVFKPPVRVHKPPVVHRHHPTPPRYTPPIRVHPRTTPGKPHFKPPVTVPNRHPGKPIIGRTGPSSGVRVGPPVRTGPPRKK